MIEGFREMSLPKAREAAVLVCGEAPTHVNSEIAIRQFAPAFKILSYSSSSARGRRPEIGSRLLLASCRSPGIRTI
jgi:hypothetical protein